ncbi:hypothetical protein MtrunA17_Chr3g0102151 [Medicago truncatula]|uniref:Uncharacterized protein n=1 Tax=Medicago truncatula TaxID=3880 RepID=A0A396ISC4_MEDTR|nr:uncharacterized protein LOC112419890 [Medicago truncatula]RHN67383.1 hypothetical protein MtrunA17_Chr3g0102151 [Medicago truncatula]
MHSDNSAIKLPIFEGENYHLWPTRMEAYLDTHDLWEAVEDDYEVEPLPDNPTLAQIRNHKERKQRKSKAKSYLFSAVSEAIFTRIMALKSAKAIWDFLKQEYEGNEKVKGMQVLNLIREFEMQRMKESETIKEYADKLLSIVNNVRLLGGEFSDIRIVRKCPVTVPERFESTISSLENSKDMSTITLSAQIPRKFDFQTTKASITIPPIPKSNLSGFIFCTIVSKCFHVHNLPLNCVIFEHGKEVDRCFVIHDAYIGALISDHVLICWHPYNRQKLGSNDCNLSFQFMHQDLNEELWWSTEGIKGCGILPVYNLEHKSDLDGREIGKLKFSAQYSDRCEGISSNNENEDDQKHPCCSIGLFLRNLLRGSQE